MKENIGVVYKDKNFLVLNKPAGVIVHQPAGAPISKMEDSVVGWLRENYPEVNDVGDDPAVRPGIVHRLDRDTSGVLLVARNYKYFDYFKNLFANREIKKTYLALVYGRVEPKIGEIRKAIKIRNGTVRRTVWEGRNEKEAITRYRVLRVFRVDGKTFPQRKGVKNLSFVSLLRVTPKTGRTHQVRIHLSSFGHPVVGDALYGPRENPFNLERQFLHAESLEFNLPDTSQKNKSSSAQRIKIEVGLPKDLSRIIDELERR